MSAAFPTWVLFLLLSVPCVLQGQDKTAAKILNGEEAKTTEHPWMASIMRRSESDAYQAQFCGGALIDPYWVVTAAHCVEGESTRSIDIGLGYHDLERNEGKRYRVAEIIPHPNYFEDSQGNLHNDVALLRLASPADAFDSIALSDRSSDVAAGQLVTAFGWGATSSLGGYPTDLKKLEMAVVSLFSIQAEYDFVLDDYHLGATDPFGFGDTCGGDSGGPLVIGEGSDARLVGVVSYGFRCGVTSIPGIYANINSLRPWIESSIRGSGLSYILGDADALGDDWYRSDWLGIFNTSNYPWLFHDELGWIYAAEEDRYRARSLQTQGVWLWDDSVRRWLWTSSPAASWFSDESGNFRYFLFDGAPADIFDPTVGWSTR